MPNTPSEPVDPGRWTDESQRARDVDTIHAAFLDDLYGGDVYGDERDIEAAKERLGCFRDYVFLVFLLVLVVGGIALWLGRGDGGTADGTAGGAAAGAVAGDRPAGGVSVGDGAADSGDTVGVGDSADTADDAAPPTGTTGDATLDGVLRALGVDPGDPRLIGIADLLEDLLDSISERRPTFVRDDIDITKVTAALLRMPSDEVDRVFNNSTVHCGDTADFLVVCPAGVTDMPAGDVLMVAMTMAAPVELADPGHSFIYSAVFDSNGDPADDWIPNPPFDFDLFQGADRWYQLAWSHIGQFWSVTVTQLGADGTMTTVPSAARAVISGPNVVFAVPVAEVPNAAVRLTAFGHDGNYSESDRGADVSGVDPTEPPVVFELEPIDTAPR